MTPLLQRIREKVIETVPDIVERNGIPETWCKNHGGIMRNYSEPCTCIGPITLADVLRAIERNRKPNAFKLSVDTKGYMTLFNYKWEEQKQVDWNLSLPLEDQDPELHAFLAKVLGVEVTT